MKISVSLEVSQNSGSHTFELDDLNITEKAWNKLSEQKQTDLLQQYINDLPEQPYWVVYSYKEKNTEK